MYPSWYRKMISDVSMSDREAEANWFWDQADPIRESLATECALDLSQAIGRCIVACKAFLQCVTPHSRLFLRRARRWQIGPEAARAQGFVLDASLWQRVRRVVIDDCDSGAARLGRQA